MLVLCVRRPSHVFCYFYRHCLCDALTFYHFLQAFSFGCSTLSALRTQAHTRTVFIYAFVEHWLTDIMVMKMYLTWIHFFRSHLFTHFPIRLRGWDPVCSLTHFLLGRYKKALQTLALFENNFTVIRRNNSQSVCQWWCISKMINVCDKNNWVSAAFQHTQLSQRQREGERGD